MPNSLFLGKHYMRRTFYIKKEFQKRFISEYVILIFVGAAVANGVLYALLKKGVDDTFYRAHIGIISTADVVLSPLVFTGVAVFFSSFIAVAALTAANIWRITSRLHCLAEGIEGLKNGNLTVRIELCEGSLLSEVADIFNRSVRHLNGRVAHIKSGVDEIEAAELGFKTDRANAIEEVIKKVESAEGHLSAFKLRQ